MDPLAIPAFLIRHTQARMTNEEAKNLVSPKQRAWAPIKSAAELERRPSLASITTSTALAAMDDDLPIRVQLKNAKQAGSTLLAEYASRVEFNRHHDLKTYPIKGEPVVFEGRIVILVTAKPWAGKQQSTQAASPASTVDVNGTSYRSVLAAFQALGLPINKHQKFRSELKAKGELPFVHDDKTFIFRTR